MRHLSEEQLVRLFLENGPACQGRKHQSPGGEHLAVCPACRAKFEELHEVTAFLKESRVAAPASAWSQLKGRLVRSRRPGRDWTEPRWLPLVVVHLTVVVIALALILVLGGWLESSSAWDWLGRLTVISKLGPRGVVALVFLIGGGLGVLALTPVLWWESRSRG